jgi:hypothetical protein
MEKDIDIGVKFSLLTIILIPPLARRQHDPGNQEQAMTNHPFQAGCFRHRSLSRPRPLVLALALLLAGGPLAIPSPATARGGFRGGVGFGRVGGYRFGGGFEEADRWRVDMHPVFGPGVRPAAGVGAEGARFYDRPYNGWHADWAGGGYWRARPWTTGWYRVNPVGWGWWRAGAAAWGVAGLASAATISSLVNTAAEQQATAFVVPETPYQLNFASVEPVGQYGASFSYSTDGEGNLFGGVNCQEGLLNGQIPATAAQAQLLNAVCQVAFGSPA